MKESKKYMNPYLGGALLGLVLVAAFWVSGRGLGASGAAKSVVAVGVKSVAPSHFDNSLFFSEYKAEHANPLN